MLVFESGQMATYEQQAREKFLARLVAHVRGMFPARCAALGKSGMRAAVQRHAADARRYGFHTERQIAAYVDLGFICGDDFSGQGWAAPILADGTGDPDHRIRRLQIKAHAQNAQLEEWAV